MMQGSELSLLSNWQNFFMIIGTIAATLTGLMFVETTLISGIDKHVSTLDAGLSAFTTPTVVHFCAVLMIAGIQRALASVFKCEAFTHPVGPRDGVIPDNRNVADAAYS
jgi:hypothetical protein